MTKHFAVGVDIGGTFTDVVLIDRRTGAARAASALLEITPQVPVVERMAAIWGPDLAPMLLALIESAPGATALRRLCDYTDGYPEAVDALAALSIYPEAAEPDQAAVSDAGLPPKDSSL